MKLYIQLIYSALTKKLVIYKPAIKTLSQHCQSTKRKKTRIIAFLKGRWHRFPITHQIPMIPDIDSNWTTQISLRIQEDSRASDIVSEERTGALSEDVLTSFHSSLFGKCVLLHLFYFVLKQHKYLHFGSVILYIANRF